MILGAACDSAPTLSKQIQSATKLPIRFSAAWGFPVGVMMMMIGSMNRQSGAFEVLLDDAIIYSKLQTGSMPEANELIATISSRIQ